MSATAPVALSRPVAVIGAGLTGLAAAHALHRAGRTVVVFEADDAPGGVIRSASAPGGWLIEAGPNSMQETPEVAALLADLGLTPRRLAAAPAAKNRYIVRDGHLRALPASPPALLGSSLFSIGTKARLLTELFQRPRQRAADLPLADFFREHFGSELLNYALDPFVSGIYAGDARRLSARHAFPSLWAAERDHGSIVRGMIAKARAKRPTSSTRRSGPPPIVSFPEGLAELPLALAASLPAGALRLNAPVRQITRASATQEGGWTLDAAPGETFARVLLTLPAPALTRLCVDADTPDADLAALAAVPHPPVTSLFLGYRRSDVAHPLDGFGALLPSREGRPLLGVLFSSTLFPGRAPAGHVALTVMLGGARSPELARASQDEQLAVARAELASLLGVRGEPVLVRRSVWPHAIPQYELGHERVLERLASFETRHPGLAVGGPLRDGIGLPACLAAGRRLASG